MREEEYRDFSFKYHQKAGNKPLVAQMEVTLRCPLHCQHCYADIYSSKEALKHELSTQQVKMVMDKCKAAGTVWFCFTGGDPLLRRDFIELYLYAKKLGFITSIFTSLVTLTPKILAVFKQSPPFAIETTLNAATAKTYRTVTETNHFFTQLFAIQQLLANGIAVKVKTQVTTQSVEELGAIKKLVTSWGLKFRPGTLLNARSDGDCWPTALRLPPPVAVQVNKRYGNYDEDEQSPGKKLDLKSLISRPKTGKLFSCAAGGHAYFITVEGKMTICGTYRKSSYDLLKSGHTVKQGFYSLNRKIHNMCFKTESRCRYCHCRRLCKWCPARAYLETGKLETPIPYFCQLAKETVKQYAR